LKYLEFERRFEGSCLTNGQGFADPIEKRKGAAQSTGIAILPIDRVKSKFRHLALVIEIHVEALRRQDKIFLNFLHLHKGCLQTSHLLIEPINTVGLDGRDGKAKRIIGDIKGILELESTQSVQILVFGERSYEVKSSAKQSPPSLIPKDISGPKISLARAIKSSGLMGNFDSAKAFEMSISMGLVGVSEKAQAITKERREMINVKHFIMDNEIILSCLFAMRLGHYFSLVSCFALGFFSTR
jgi:hypothetical protein